MSEENPLLTEGMLDAQPTDATDTPDASPAPEAGQADAENPEQGGAESAPFPKKAVNALNSKDKKIRRLRAQNQDLRQRESDWNEEQKSSQPDPEPVDSDFESYGDYLKARQDWQINGHRSKDAVTQKTDSFKQQHAEVRQERMGLLAENRETLVASIPDADSVLSGASQAIGALPKKIRDFILELDSPAYALYNLAKDGRLEGLGGMSPSLAAAELVAAQTPRAQTLNSVPASLGDAQPAPTAPVIPAAAAATPQTPRPMAAAKGAGTSTRKDLDSMDAGDLRKWAKS